MKGSTASIRELSEFIWAEESRLSLLEWTVSGIYLWPIVRLCFFYRIAQELRIFAEPHPARASSPSANTSVLGDAYACLTGKPLSRIKPGCPALFPLGRPVRGIEVHTDGLRRALGADVTVIDLEGRGTGADLDTGSLSRTAARVARERARWFDLSKEPRIRALEKNIRDRFQLGGLNLGRRFAQELYRFDFLRRTFARSFRSQRISAVYLADGYGRRFLTAAARENGIPVIELQHGCMGRYHFGYNFPGRPSVPYSPDELWTFGRYWAEATELPRNVAVRVIGAPETTALPSERPNRKLPGRILFSSQGVIGVRLFHFARETARLLPESEIVFRLHPNETPEPFIDELARHHAPSNFSLSHREPDLYTLLATAPIQAGVFSTTLFEGMAFDARVVLVALPGIENMNPVLDRGDAILVSTPEEFAARFREAPSVRDFEYYFERPAGSARVPIRVSADG